MKIFTRKKAPAITRGRNLLNIRFAVIAARENGLTEDQVMEEMAAAIFAYRLMAGEGL